MVNVIENLRQDYDRLRNVCSGRCAAVLLVPQSSNLRPGLREDCRTEPEIKEDFLVLQELPDEVFPAASLIKLFVLFHFLSQVDRGSQDVDAEIVLKRSDIVPGYGVLKELSPGLRLTLLDLSTLMIVLSDNVATNLLIDHLGIEAIQQTILGLGCKQSALQRMMCDFESAKAGKDNLTSAADIARLLSETEDGNKLSIESKVRFLSMLSRQQCRNKLPPEYADAPKAGLSFAHKTGDLPQIEHDVGFVSLNNSKLIVVAMTRELEAQTDGIEYCRGLWRIATKFLQQQHCTALRNKQLLDNETVETLK